MHGGVTLLCPRLPTTHRPVTTPAEKAFLELQQTCMRGKRTDFAAMTLAWNLRFVHQPLDLPPEERIYSKNVHLLKKYHQLLDRAVRTPEQRLMAHALNNPSPDPSSHDAPSLMQSAGIMGYFKPAATHAWQNSSSSSDDSNISNTRSSSIY